jgi:putative addiction module component (TIGR02574 family)
MSKTLDDIERDALNLLAEERAFLADRLLSSLGDETLSDVDAAWVAEAERRYQAYKEGKRKPIPASEVFDEADSMTE